MEVGGTTATAELAVVVVEVAMTAKLIVGGDHKAGLVARVD